MWKRILRPTLFLVNCVFFPGYNFLPVNFDVLRMGAMGSLDHRQKWRKEEIPISVHKR